MTTNTEDNFTASIGKGKPNAIFIPEHSYKYVLFSPRLSSRQEPAVSCVHFDANSEWQITSALDKLLLESF